MTNRVSLVAAIALLAVSACSGGSTDTDGGELPTSTGIASETPENGLATEALSELHVRNFLRAFEDHEVRRSGWTDYSSSQLIEEAVRISREGGVKGSANSIDLVLFDDVVLTLDVLEGRDGYFSGLGQRVWPFDNSLDGNDRPPSDGIYYGVSTWTDPGLLGERISGYWADEVSDVTYRFSTLIRPDGSEGIYVIETGAMAVETRYDVALTDPDEIRTWLCAELDLAPPGITPEEYVSAMPSQGAASFYGPVYPLSKIVLGFATCGGGTEFGQEVASILAFSDHRIRERSVAP